MTIRRLTYGILCLLAVKVIIGSGRYRPEELGRKSEATKGQLHNHNAARNNIDAASLHAVSTLLLGQGDESGKNLLLYQWSWTGGVGSTTIWIMVIGLFFRETQNRQLVLDESRSSQYRWNTTNGLFSSFFRLPRIPIVDATSEYQLVKEQISLLGADRADILYPFSVDQLQNLTWMTPYSELFNSQSKFPILKVAQVNPPFRKLRHAITKHYELHKHLSNLLFFDKLSRFACDNLDWLGSSTYSVLEDEVAQEVRQRSEMELTRASMPNLTGGYSSRTPQMGDEDGTGAAATILESVAFHIRRTDKKYEAGVFDVDKYATKLRSVVLAKAKTTSPEEALARIQHCFVATDDYTVVAELTQALRNLSVPCEVYTLATEEQTTDRESKGDNIRFLTEIKLLVDATYFIGTFSSNVGGLVALLRGCDRMVPQLDTNALASRLNHYYNSYGVDYDDWLLWDP